MTEQKVRYEISRDWPPPRRRQPQPSQITTEITRPETFRILIIGRANAGKTTLLRAVCGAEGEPDLYDRDDNKVRTQLCDIRLSSHIHTFLQRGEHNIEYALKFPSNPGFSFHDSRGFESGAVDELEVVRQFIRSKAGLGSMKKQLHAIWYCFSADNNRFMTAADKEFFNTIDTGSVPVIAIFTKFDALDSVAFSALSAQGIPFEEAQKRAPEYAKAQFDQELMPLIEKLAHPPRAVVCLRNMHNKSLPDLIQKAASELIEKTEAALDDDALKVLLVQAQYPNVELCLKAALK
ncbi:hypothetical protein BOTBODRAFT_99917 [Botryobasidium botryosum FD-172 SS1]|uniref:Uncharacterized protein n=1 Tax=Botryobasidium botryosum (strain FD-172 SS1) TaxID=930990 RepID=A0A067NC49_BOTB1|nr:hypothetical protein BOTBODRAFT_99917 [Botryobasidium botryosum FD-172 SS1]